MCHYSLGIGLVLLETRVWSVHHHWLVATTLTACVAWIAAFMLGAISWHVVRREPWVEQLVCATLALMEFFFACSALSMLVTLAIPHRTANDL